MDQGGQGLPRLLFTVATATPRYKEEPPVPQLTTVLTVDDLQRRRSSGVLDLSSYLELLDTVREQGGVGAVLTLSEGENQRTEKRRLSVAAKERGYDLVWRRAPEGQLRFVLAEAGQRPPDARRRRSREERPGGHPAVDTVVAEDPAGISGTTTTTIGMEQPEDTGP